MAFLVLGRASPYGSILSSPSLIATAISIRSSFSFCARQPVRISASTNKESVSELPSTAPFLCVRMLTNEAYLGLHIRT